MNVNNSLEKSVFDSQRYGKKEERIASSEKVEKIAFTSLIGVMGIYYGIFAYSYGKNYNNICPQGMFSGFACFFGVIPKVCAYGLALAHAVVASADAISLLT